MCVGWDAGDDVVQCVRAGQDSKAWVEQGHVSIAAHDHETNTTSPGTVLAEQYQELRSCVAERFAELNWIREINLIKSMIVAVCRPGDVYHILSQLCMEDYGNANV